MWDIPPESANRVQHPAPFPVELPQRLIELYTFTGDLVLDPFLGSGSTVVAARRSGKGGRRLRPRPGLRGVGAGPLGRRGRSARGGDGVGAEGDGGPGGREVGGGGGADHGTSASTLAKSALASAGFVDVRPNRRLPGLGLVVSFTARDAAGVTWYFELAGPNSAFRSGMSRTETVWRTLGRAHVMANNSVTPW